MDSLTSRIHISIKRQELSLYQADILRKTYLIASAKNGIGQLMGSECTPLGTHRICEKIGDNAVKDSVFVARQFTGEIYSEDLAKLNPDRDWILTRILWLEGLEVGFNQGDFIGGDETNNLNGAQRSIEQGDAISCDTRQRFIYIHGCPDSHPMQIPSSHGCIKMRNADIIELFDFVNTETLVDIQQ